MSSDDVRRGERGGRAQGERGRATAQSVLWAGVRRERPSCRRSRPGSEAAAATVFVVRVFFASQWTGQTGTARKQVKRRGPRSDGGGRYGLLEWHVSQDILIFICPLPFSPFLDVGVSRRGVRGQGRIYHHFGQSSHKTFLQLFSEVMQCLIWSRVPVLGECVQAERVQEDLERFSAGNIMEFLDRVAINRRLIQLLHNSVELFLIPRFGKNGLSVTTDGPGWRCWPILVSESWIPHARQFLECGDTVFSQEQKEFSWGFHKAPFAEPFKAARFWVGHAFGNGSDPRWLC